MEPQRSVWLNDFQFPIRGNIHQKRITPFPNQFMTTAPTENDYTPTRKQTWGKLKGGMGLEKWTPQDNDRYWTADGVDASLSVQTLEPLVTTMGTGGDAFGAEIVKIIKYRGRIWAIGHNQISYWDGAEWKSVKTDFPNPTDAITFYGAL